MPIVHVATNQTQVKACFPVMQELRTHLSLEEFLERVQIQTKEGYTLAYVDDAGTCVAVAGFRINHHLLYGKFLYVDDLVTLNAERSKGHGKYLLEWLVSYAKQQGCAALHLDSGVQRKDAHRFYEREGMNVTSLHFAIQL